LTKFVHGAWIAIAGMAVITMVLLSIHRHYQTVGRQLRQRVVPAGTAAENHVVLLVPDLGPATAEALGWIRASRVQEVRAVYLPRGAPEADIRPRWTSFCRA